jgi:hypothetical protein
MGVERTPLVTIGRSQCVRVVRASCAAGPPQGRYFSDGCGPRSSHEPCERLDSATDAVGVHGGG